MNKILSVTLALLFGFISTQELSDSQMFLASDDTTDVGTSDKSEETTLKTKASKWMTDANEDLKRLNCLMYNDLTFFDIRKLEEGNTYKVNDINFNFCKRMIDSDGDKTFAYRTVELEYGGPVYTRRLTDGNKPSKI